MIAYIIRKVLFSVLVLFAASCVREEPIHNAPIAMCTMLCSGFKAKMMSSSSYVLPANSSNPVTAKPTKPTSR